ncbi:MAG: chloride channel protein [Phycisphaerales bacterium]|nr:chloride channel protein [Phycisphaerales bacterium]
MQPPFLRTLHALRRRLPMPNGHWARRLILSVIVGTVAGLVSAGLEDLLRLGTDHFIGTARHVGDASIFEFRWPVLVMPTVGGLIGGLVLAFLLNGDRTHGVVEYTNAFHRQMGRLRLRRPVINALGSIATISSGGSAGMEGPISALGAAIGSTFSRLFPLTPQDRRVLLVAGCAAGIGAIFRTPLGGALFAASVLYSDPEFEGDALVSSVVASVMSYATFVSIWGAGETLLPKASALRFESAVELIPYAVLGPVCGVMGIFFYGCMHTVEHRLVRRWPLPIWLLPAFGGLLTGVLACILPQVMDGRYLFLQNALDPAFYTPLGWSLLKWSALFAAVAVLKCVATACTVGSGMPGGVLGPSVAVGGATGGAIGALAIAVAPEGMFDPSLQYALIPVGMGGVVACAMGTPLAAVVMVTEMTGSYGLIAPLMLVCITSYVIGRRWSLNPAQVRSSVESPAHLADPIIHTLESWTVGHLMESNWALTVPPNTGLDELAARIEPGTRPVFAVAEAGELLGVVSVADITAIGAESASGLPGLLVASDIMTPSSDLVVVHPESQLYDALTLFGRTNHEVLPVFSRRRRAWVGMLSRRSVVDRLRAHFEEAREAMLEEHIGLAAIGRDLQMQQLMMTISPVRTERVQRLFVPIDAIGKSLRETDFRRRYGANVIAVEQRDGSCQCPPDLDAPLRTEQRLLVIIEDRPEPETD